MNAHPKLSQRIMAIKHTIFDRYEDMPIVFELDDIQIELEKTITRSNDDE